MDASITEKEWPLVPEEYLNKPLNLPAKFRCAVVANPLYSNEEIGRIVRCIAFNSDFLITNRIAPVVNEYGRILKDKELLLARQYRFRDRHGKRNQRPMFTTVSIDEQNGQNEGFRCDDLSGNEPTFAVENDVSGASAASLSCSKKVPSSIPKRLPINNSKEYIRKVSSSSLEKVPSSSLENSGDNCNSQFIDSIGDGEHSESQGDKTQKAVQGDLFQSNSEHAINGETAESTRRPLGSPRTKDKKSDDKSTVQDIERAPGASTGKSESRNVRAWVPERFAEFWKAYPRKVGKGKALKAFTKIIVVQKDVDKFMETTLASIAWWKKQQQWREDDGRYIPYPSSWLNGGCWEDITSVAETERDCASGKGTTSGSFLGRNETAENIIKRFDEQQ